MEPVSLTASVSVLCCAFAFQDYKPVDCILNLWYTPLQTTNMYSVRQFIEKDGGTVSLINNQWFTPRRCEVFWPLVKGTKAFERLLADAKTPDEKWKIYSGQRVFCETVSYLRTFRGRDISSKVSRIMKFCFTDQLAEQYNFYGKRSNKKPFCQLRLRECIVEAVVTTTSGSTAKEVEDSIKIWLKHAPERLKRSNEQK